MESVQLSWAKHVRTSGDVFGQGNPCGTSLVDRSTRTYSEATQRIGRFDETVTLPHRSNARLPILADTLHAALGRGGRENPTAAKTGGPAGNARLTAWTGLLLLALSAAELITLINVSGLITWHIVIGTLLIPPALLKTASTAWRIARYYCHDDDYRHAGPPPTLLRILGPGVVASTLGLLASGLVLVLIGQNKSRTMLITALGQRVDLLTVHQGFFIVWAVLTGLHVLARTLPALQLTVLGKPTTTSVDGTRLRAGAIGGAVVVAVVAATLVLSTTSSWRHDDHHRRPRDSTGVGVTGPR